MAYAIQMDKDTMVFAFQIDDVTFFLFVVRQYPSDGSLYFFLLARNCLQVLRPKGTCRFPIENIPYNESVPRIMFNKREPIISAGYVVLAVKRKRQSYIKKKQREHEKETRTKKEAEQSEFRTAGYDMWSRMEPQNEKLMAAMQQLSLKERFVVTEYVLKGKPFKEIAQETGLKEKGVASAYYRSIKKLRAEMGDVK